MKNSKRKEEMEAFAHRLQWAMTENKMNQSELARTVKLTQPQIHHYLIGKSTPRPLVRQKLAYFLHVSYHWLIWGDGNAKIIKGEYPVEDFWTTFLERLIYKMWNSGYDVRFLAQKLDVQLTTVQHWTEGQRIPREEMLINVCEILKVRPYWLLYGKGDMRMEIGSQEESFKMDWLREQYKILFPNG